MPKPTFRPWRIEPKTALIYLTVIPMAVAVKNNFLTTTFWTVEDPLIVKMTVKFDRSQIAEFLLNQHFANTEKFKLSIPARTLDVATN